MGGRTLDWDVEVEVARCSDGALAYDRRKRLLTCLEHGRPVAEVSVGEADLRNWMQVLVLRAWSPPDGRAAHEHAVHLVLQTARAHLDRGEDPFLALRQKLERAANRSSPLAG